MRKVPDAPEDLPEAPLRLPADHLQVAPQQVQPALVHHPHPPVLIVAVEEQEDHHHHVDAAVGEDLPLVVVELAGHPGLGGVQAGQALQQQLRRNPSNVTRTLLEDIMDMFDGKNRLKSCMASMYYELKNRLKFCMASMYYELTLSQE